MIPMKCLKAMPYAGRRLKPGDSFQATGESDARLLVAIGKAERAPAVAPPPVVATPAWEPRARIIAPNRYRPPAPAETEAPVADATKPKRQYRRRDLTAEE